jgi:NAD(P)-dependent dehydrogenase (short-subunit alcohol dehydrogenase family)
MTSLKNKLIGITGLSSGIGAATAAALAAQGARIVGFDRNAPAFLVEAFHQIDLADPVSIAACAELFGHRLDALCNVAGVPPTADKHTVLKVNFFGLRAFTEAMVEHLVDGAPIVNVASLAGFLWRNNIAVVTQGLATDFAGADAWIAEQDVDGAPSYHLSKELVVAWTLFNCQRWRARGIRMNSVSPGPVATPILADFIETMGQRVVDDLKENRAGEPDEIAPVIAFLLSREARWMNGADVAVDGGAGATAWSQIFG